MKPLLLDCEKRQKIGGLAVFPKGKPFPTNTDGWAVEEAGSKEESSGSREELSFLLDGLANENTSGSTKNSPDSNDTSKFEESQAGSSEPDEIQAGSVDEYMPPSTGGLDGKDPVQSRQQDKRQNPRLRPRGSNVANIEDTAAVMEDVCPSSKMARRS